MWCARAWVSRARPPVMHARVSTHVFPSTFARVLLRSRLGDSEEDLQEAQDALEEMVEEEEEEAELEEVGAVKGNPCTADGCLL